jgi:hypothetical protein
VRVNPAVEPAVTAGKVRFTVEGAHTTAGLVISRVGAGFTVTVTDWMTEHPAAVVPLI